MEFWPSCETRKIYLGKGERCVMKRLLALLGVSAMIGLAAPANGNPDDGFDDAGFLATVRDAGVVSLRRCKRIRT